MSEYSFPFAVVASGDRTATAATFAAMLAGLTGRGVLKNRLNEVAVSESSPAAMSVDVDSGMAFVGKDEEERFYRNDASLTLTIDAADPTNDRWDLIVLEMDYADSADRAISATVVKGTAAGSPSDPSLTQDEDKYQMAIARVVVGNGVTTIVDANIADLREYRQTPDGFFLMGDTDSDDVTVGQVLNQGANDDGIAAWKSSDVAHALTDQAETDTWMLALKANAAEGGAAFRYLAEDAAVSPVTTFSSFGGTATATKSTAGRSLIEFYAAEHDGANALANIAANGNVFGIRARVGGADVTRWILDEDGDTWQAGGITVGGQVEGSTGNGYLDLAGDSGASVKLRLMDAGLLLIGDTANANMTVGLTINQGANDNFIMSFKSPDVGNQLTAETLETDDWGHISKVSATGGGMALWGIADADGVTGFRSFAITHTGTQDTTKSSAGTAINEFLAYGGDPVTHGFTNVDADANIVAMRARIGGSVLTRWILDEDGDTWQAGGATFDGNVTMQGLDFDTIVAGDVIYGSAADTLSRLPKGSDGEYLRLASGIPSWDVGVLPAHGASDHTDVTRELYVPVNAVHYTGAAGSPATRPFISLSDAANDFLTLSFQVPDDFVSYTKLEVIFEGVTGTGGQDWVCDPICFYAAHGETKNTHTDLPANTTIDVAVITTLYFAEIGLTLASLAKGDNVGLKILRAGGDGADTFQGEIRIFGLLFTYVGEQ